MKILHHERRDYHSPRKIILSKVSGTDFTRISHPVEAVSHGHIFPHVIVGIYMLALEWLHFVHTFFFFDMPVWKLSNYFTACLQFILRAFYITMTEYTISHKDILDLCIICALVPNVFDRSDMAKLSTSNLQKLVISRIEHLLWRLYNDTGQTREYNPFNRVHKKTWTNNNIQSKRCNSV